MWAGQQAFQGGKVRVYIQERNHGMRKMEHARKGRLDWAAWSLFCHGHSPKGEFQGRMRHQRCRQIDIKYEYHLGLLWHVPHSSVRIPFPSIDELKEKEMWFVFFSLLLHVLDG